eukprot:SAG11_NODE_692_length_7698_cov_4.143308_9_plen_92_part_00
MVLLRLISPPEATPFVAWQAQLLSGSNDFTVKLWSLSEGGRLLHNLCAHTHLVRAVAFIGAAADGVARGASCGEDCRLLIWGLCVLPPIME